MIEMSVGRVAAAYAANRGTLALPTPPVAPPAAAATATEGVAGIGAAGTAASPFGAAPSEAGAATDFGTFLDRQVADAVDTLKQSERVSMAAVAGKASAQEVVRSVLQAEMTVQSVVAIRDKMVQAYQEIMRMAV